ncbi:MFS transporter [Nocardia transvalensis]|uniref:MFS transporter n=1 Tax=Nocardia transvalensis TaxID=37333 RepID=UPI001E435D85|nr:MFS transporter [Nocardia transvalensis]
MRGRRERRTIVLCAVALLSCLFGIDTVTHASAVVQAQQEFEMAPRAAALAAGIGTLLAAACVLGAGVLGDRTGRRRLLLYGGVGVVVGATITAYAPTAELFILGRAITGAATAVAFVTALALLPALFFHRELPWVFGVWLGIEAVGILSGGIAGTVLSVETVWRNGYLLTAWIAAAGVLLAWLTVPDAPRAAPRRFDVGGLLWATVALVAAVGGIEYAGLHGWGNSVVLGAAAVSLSAFAIFLRTERRFSRPVFPAEVFDSLPFGAACLAGVVFGFVDAAYTRQTARLLGDYLNGSALTVTLSVVPLYLGMLLGAVLAGQAQENGMSARAVLASGLMCCGLGTVGLVFVDEHTEVWLYAVAGALIGFGAMGAQNAQAVLIMSAVPPRQAGSAAAAKFAMGQVGFGLSLSMLAPIVAAMPDSAPTGSVAANVDGYSEAMFVTAVVVCTAAVAVTILVSGNLARVVVRTALPHRRGTWRWAGIRPWYRPLQPHGEQPVAQVEGGPGEQVGVPGDPGATVEVRAQARETLAQLGFGGEGEHGHAGADGRIEVGVWATPEGAAEAVGAVEGHGDGGDRDLAEAIDQFVQLHGEHAVGLGRGGQILPQQPEFAVHTVIPGQDDDAAAGDPLHLRDAPVQVGPVMHGEHR